MHCNPIMFKKTHQNSFTQAKKKINRRLFCRKSNYMSGKIEVLFMCVMLLIDFVLISIYLYISAFQLVHNQN